MPDVTRKVLISNELGLHARAAAKIVALAGNYTSSLHLRRGDEEVDGRSILAILTLACPKGTEVWVKAAGEDSEALIEALVLLFDQKFGEPK